MNKFKSSLFKDAFSQVEIGQAILEKNKENVKKNYDNDDDRQWTKFNQKAHKQIWTLNSKPEDKKNYLSFSQLEEHRPYELHKEIGSM